MHTDAGPPGPDDHAAPRQPDAGPQRIAAVVARADHQQHPGAVGPVQAAQDRRGQAGRGPLHQVVRVDVLERPGLGGSDLGDPVAVHQDSQTTMAAATPASWVIETKTRFTPSSARRAATVP